MSRCPGWLPVLVAVGLPALLYAGICIHRYDGGPILRGDGIYYVATATSLIEDGDLDLANQVDVFRRGDSRGDLARDVAGRLVPKHPVPMPVAALAFVALAGIQGALLFNLLQLLALLWVLYLLARRFANPWPAAIAVVATGTLSILPHYVWNFSPDVFATLLLALVLLALPPQLPGREAAAGWRYLLAGLLLGLAIWSKVSMLLLAPGLLLLCRPFVPRNVTLLAVGALVLLLCYGWFNWQLFGSPFTTSYDRIARFEDGEWVLLSQRDDFGSPLAHGLVGQMLDPKVGLLTTSLVTVVSCFGLGWLWTRDRRTTIYLATGMVALYLFFSCYRWWDTSHHGNRFLMPVIALCALPLAAAIDGVTRPVGPGYSSRP